jgi:hypothetical protein
MQPRLVHAQKHGAYLSIGVTSCMRGGAPGRGSASLLGALLSPILPAALALEPLLVLLAVGHDGTFEGVGLSL